MNRKDFRPTSDVGSLSSNDRNFIRAKRKSKYDDKKSGYVDVHEKRSIGRDRTSQVNEAFINGKSKGSSGDNLHTDGKYLYSYDTVIAVKQSDGRIVVNNTPYSATTTKQTSSLISDLKSSKTPYDVTGGKQIGYEGEDFSEEIKDEKTGAKHYEQLAKENPEHKELLQRMANNEKEHEKRLKEIDEKYNTSDKKRLYD